MAYYDVPCIGGTNGKITICAYGRLFLKKWLAFGNREDLKRRNWYEDVILSAVERHRQKRVSGVTKDLLRPFDRCNVQKPDRVGNVMSLNNLSDTRDSNTEDGDTDNYDLDGSYINNYSLGSESDDGDEEVGSEN